MGGRAVTPAVLAFLSGKPGKPVTLDQIARGTGLDPRQIQSAITNMRRNNPEMGRAISVLSRGQMWRYEEGAAQSSEPAPAAAEPLALGANLVLVGFGDRETLFLRDENGMMYTAQRARLR